MPRADSRQQEAPEATFRVLWRNLPELQARIGALARRAERLGTSPLALHDTGQGDDLHVLVVLEGEPPSLAGWALAAVVDHRCAEATLRIVSSRAPALDPQRFRTPRCDHCRLKRRRVETFVVWHAATQRLRQVGTGCLRDFLGGHDAERLCHQAEYVLLARASLAAAASPRHAPDVADDAVALERFAAHAAMVLRRNADGKGHTSPDANARHGLQLRSGGLVGGQPDHGAGSGSSQHYRWVSQVRLAILGVLPALTGLLQAVA